MRSAFRRMSCAGKLWAALLAALTWSVSACADDRVATSSETVLRIDSAGVEVITNLMETDALPVDSVRGEPVLVIRPDEQGDVVFHRIAGVVPLEAGGVAVGSAEPRTVYVFDEEGDLQRSLGGPGEGPGEFRYILDVFVISPDSLAVFDNWLGRITVFSAEGIPARTIDLRRFVPPASGANVYPTSDGFAFVGIASLGGPRAQSSYRDSAGSYLLDVEGDSVGYYGRFPGAEVMYTERLFGALPFGGLLSSAVRDDHLIVGTGDEPELREYDATGEVIRIIRWPDHDREVSSKRMEEYVDFRISTMPEDERAAYEETIRAFPHSPTEPAYYDLVGSPDGALWLGDYPGPEFLGPNPPVWPKTWTIIRDDGVRLRRIVGPPGFTLEALRDGLAYGVRVDELGRESIEVYRVPEVQ